MTATTAELTIGSIPESSILKAIFENPGKFGELILKNAERLHKVLPIALPIDPKTGLLHGSYFENVKLPEYLKKSYEENKNIAYMVYDINNLEEINKNPRYGKSIGDLVVQAVAHSLESFFKIHMPDSIIARIDYGDEFAIATFGSKCNSAFGHTYILAEDALRKVPEKAKEYIKHANQISFEDISLKCGIIDIKPPKLSLDANDELNNQLIIKNYISAIKDSSERAVQSARNHTKTIEIGQFAVLPKIF